MQAQKLEWIRKITTKQIILMCMLMVVIYAFATNSTDEATNLIESVGSSYAIPEDANNQQAAQTLFVPHESGLIAKTAVPMVNDQNLSDVELIFTNLQTGNLALLENVDGLIPQSARIRDYRVVNDILTLNLSESFLYYHRSIEENLLTSLVWSMTELPNVKRVRFEIEGDPVQNLNGIIDVRHGLTRDMGINMEVAVAENFWNTKMLRLYFLASDATPQNMSLIPISRLISANSALCEYETAIEALISGSTSGAYVSAFDPRVTLLERPKVEDHTISLNFSSELFYDKAQTQISEKVIWQLVSTLTSFAEIEAVAIAIEGKPYIFED